MNILRLSKLGFIGFFLLFIISSCSKSNKEIIEDNDVPYYDEIPTLLVENYVNRLYIDLLGREPLDTEMAAEVANLRAGDLQTPAREELITKLQTDTTFIIADSSYRRAYKRWLNTQLRAHLIEGASDVEVNELRGPVEASIAQMIAAGTTDTDEYYRAVAALARYDLLLLADRQYFQDSISVLDVVRRMIHNGVYDQINMNSFNFVNATFDNLLYRNPTEEEFENAFLMVENNEPAILFGGTGNTKEDFIRLFTESIAVHEGIIIWLYKSILAREPSSEEVIQFLEKFYLDLDIEYVQRELLKLDEYANFD